MNKKQSKILVVGGAGYIGGLTTNTLIEKGHDVTVYDNLMYETRFLKNCNFIFGDIRDTKKLVKIHSSFDKIVWLAAIVGDGACAEDPELTKEINVSSLKRFLEETKRSIVFTSTCSIYGAQDKLSDEKTEPNPLSLYANTKLEAEKYVLDNGGLVLRLGTLFGLGDGYSRVRLDLVVNLLTLKALRERKLTVFGGEQWRPIISVKDVVGYLAEGVEKDLKGVFNLKYKNIRIIELAKMIKEVFPDITIEKTGKKYEDLRSYRVNTAKAEKAFDFVPQTTVKAEVLRMKKLFSEKRIKNFDSEVYYNVSYIKVLLKNKQNEK